MPLRYFLVMVMCMLVGGGLCAVDCSETECGPRVSKCMLLKACNCSMTRENILNNSCTCCNECIQCLDKQYTQCCSCFEGSLGYVPKICIICSINGENILNNSCTCCNECIQCLDKQYTQCCSCFGLCNPDKEAPHMNSYVDKFDQDDGDLIVFDKVATVNKVGTTYTFPVLQEHQKDIKEGKEMKQLRNIKGGTNCTVVYLDKCLSHEQCSRQCLILGASMLRWFHTGCCECIGHTCLPYGSNTARCKHCTEFEEESTSGRRQTEL